MIKDGFFKSEQVKVFPCARRGQTKTGDDVINPEARLQTEFNYIHSGAAIALNGDQLSSYLISYEYELRLIKCVIGGYYFEITLDEKDLNDTGIYGKVLCIKIANNISIGNDTTEMLEAWEDGAAVLDANGYFIGLNVLEENKISSTTGISAKLKIFDINGNILPEAYLKFPIDKLAAKRFGTDYNYKVLEVGHYDDSKKATENKLVQRFDAIQADKDGVIKVKEGLTFEVVETEEDINY